uniref:Uncharacterized protein n=1 Tax=Aegilops tauschii subsp. strangulata TaxID=200361 RepID=A0A453AAD2_AEGTS
MGFVSFVGRVLFASVFLLSAYQEFSEFGTDGGPAAKSLKPKFNLFVKQVSAGIGMAVPHIDFLFFMAFVLFVCRSSLSLPLPCFLKPLVVSFSSSAARSERSYCLFTWHS